MIGLIKRLLRKGKTALRLLFVGQVDRRKLRSFREGRISTQLSFERSQPVETIGLVVPCYKHAKYLPKTLDSIANQTMKPTVIAFVDDCSPDSTASILQDYISSVEIKNKGTRYVLLRNENNLGQAASINKAIERIETQAIMILNDDDYLVHDAVEIMLELLNLNKELVMVGADCIPFTSDQQLHSLPMRLRDVVTISTVQLTKSLPTDALGYRKCNDLNMTHSGSIFLTDAWRAVGGYYENKNDRVVPFSDRDFQLRVNSIFPVGTAYGLPITYWRSNSSVDAFLNS